MREESEEREQVIIFSSSLSTLHSSLSLLPVTCYVSRRREGGYFEKLRGLGYYWGLSAPSPRKRRCGLPGAALSIRRNSMSRVSARGGTAEEARTRALAQIAQFFRTKVGDTRELLYTYPK
jgi:hypothetical protein